MSKKSDNVSKKSKKTMHIWTVSSTDDTMRFPVEHHVAGSYTSYERALDEAVDYVMERVCDSDNWSLMYAFSHDENHEEMNDALDWDDNTVVYNNKTKDEIRDYVRSELEGGCYYIFDGEDTYHFDIDENDLVME